MHFNGGEQRGSRGENPFFDRLCLIVGDDSANGFGVQTKNTISLACSIFFLAATPLTSQAQIVWQIGQNDNTHLRTSSGGGTNANFVQENGTINPLPGVPNSPAIDRQADNDYYLAGSYFTTIPSIVATYGDYTPVGNVPANEEAAERAFAGSDNDLRYHFNLPSTLQPTDLLSVTFDALDLDGSAGNTDPRYGIEVYFNGVLVQPQITIRPPQLNVSYTSPQFTLASVNAQVGPGFDNIVSLKGISHSTEGGGSWMGIDYVRLDAPTNAIPTAVFPWVVGKDDNAHGCNMANPCSGGGTNATFVQENGSVNPLPGSPNSPKVDQQADNDYYFAGNYTTTIGSVTNKYGAYTPVGLVSTNEEAVERAFAGGDTDLRYHFNLPNTLSPSDKVAVTFDPLDLDNSGGNPHYGVEVYFNGVLVQPQIMIRPAQLGQAITTPSFTLGSVNAAVGSGFDNIVTLHAINYGAEGGGNWMGIDYVRMDLATNSVPPPVLPWSVGLNDDAWPSNLEGGGTNAAFVDSDGISNPLPGTFNDDEFGFQADDDYYFAGVYTSVIPGNGTYSPVGSVYVNEDAVAKGFSGADNDLRYHFNLPTTLSSNAVLSVTFDPLVLDTSGADPRYGVEVYFNNVLVQTQLVIRPAQIGQAISTPRFTASSVNAQVGPGFDNIIRLRGINYGATGGGDSLGLDYIRLNVHPVSPFPWMVGRNDNAWPAGDGGGPNTSFVQENGSINPLPGRPDSPEAAQQGDNDYYFAGDYTTTIPSVVAHYGGVSYTPVGSVLANEESAERAFAGGDLDLRYHFNLPTSLSSNDSLSVTFEPLNLDDVDAPDINQRRFGVEVYFNGVLVQTQIVVRPPQLTVGITTPEFSLASVNAQFGPGFDNIVSLKGISYNAEGGGNWMGIDYVQLNGPKPLQFLPAVITNGVITLKWTGTGALEWAPTVLGPWTPITPQPTSPYSEPVISTANRFFRLRK